MKHHTPSSFLGCILGTAVGDALGLPAEGLSKARVARLWPDVRHRFILGRGMVSDDTEHTMMVASALISHQDDEVAFQRALGWKLRWWFAALPAGVGLSTAKAIVKLWLGFPASRSGVRSAGNGAAMRSAIIGVCFADEPDKRRRFALAGCRVTHTDPRAEESALLVAEAAAMACRKAPLDEILHTLSAQITSEEMRIRFTAMKAALHVSKSVADYAAEIGCGRGVSGFAPNTVAVALYSWLRNRPRFDLAISEVIRCGGDTDSVAAITGAICGAEVGETGIPKEWLAGICEYPRSISYMRQLAAALADEAQKPPHLSWWAMLPRNFVFLIVVLMHGFRRLFPPY